MEVQVNDCSREFVDSVENCQEVMWISWIVGPQSRRSNGGFHM